MSASMPTSDAPENVTVRDACCTWRAAIQIPLLLLAAAGLGFAGQPVWHSRNDFQGLLGYSAGGTCASHSSAAAVDGCGAASDLTLASGCGAAAHVDAVVEVDVDESVSALAPDNVTTEL